MILDIFNKEIRKDILLNNKNKDISSLNDYLQRKYGQSIDKFIEFTQKESFTGKITNLKIIGTDFSFSVETKNFKLGKQVAIEVFYDTLEKIEKGDLRTFFDSRIVNQTDLCKLISEGIEKPEKKEINPEKILTPDDINNNNNSLSLINISSLRENLSGIGIHIVKCDEKTRKFLEDFIFKTFSPDKFSYPMGKEPVFIYEYPSWVDIDVIKNKHVFIIFRGPTFPSTNMLKNCLTFNGIRIR